MMGVIGDVFLYIQCFYIRRTFAFCRFTKTIDLRNNPTRLSKELTIQSHGLKTDGD
jgi:hypothetical protein